MLENGRKSIKRWMHQKRNKCFITEKLLSLERVMTAWTVKRKKKYLNAIRNQSAIAQQNRKISKLHVDVYISQFCQTLKGRYYVCTVCNRMLYRKSVLIFNKQNMSTATFKTSLQKNYLIIMIFCMSSFRVSISLHRGGGRGARG